MIYSCEAEFHGIFERFFDDGFTIRGVSGFLKVWGWGQVVIQVIMQRGAAGGGSFCSTKKWAPVPPPPPSLTPLTMQIPQKPPIATYLYTVDRVWKLLSKNLYSDAFSYRDLEQIDPILNFPLSDEDLELVVLHSAKLWRIMKNDSHLKLFYSILPILFDFLLQNGF